MVKISRNHLLTMNKGDDFIFPLFINVGTQLRPFRYTLRDNDVLYFGVMEPNCDFENAIIRKRYTKDNLNGFGDVLVRFDTKDTAKLVPGTYYYEIKLLQKTKKEDTQEDEYVETITTKRKFTIID